VARRAAMGTRTQWRLRAQLAPSDSAGGRAMHELSGLSVQYVQCIAAERAGVSRLAASQQQVCSQRRAPKDGDHNGHRYGGRCPADADKGCGGRSDDVLQHAQERRRTPGGARVAGERQRRGVGEDNALTGDDDEERWQDADQANVARDGREQGDPACWPLPPSQRPTGGEAARGRRVSH